MADIAIVRYRGDTVADEFTVKDAAGVAVNITGFTFKLTVDTLKAPPDNTTKLYDITGIITDAANGVVEFVPTSPNANQTPGKYFFDVQMTDGSGRIQTIQTGTYTYKQDITK